MTDKDYEFAGTAIALTIRALKDRFTDTEIKNMFTRKKIDGFIKILNEKDCSDV